MYVDMRNPPHRRRPWASHYGRWLERIEEAERLGADAVWLTEHHFFDDGYLPQCWTLAAAIAARTHRIRIGTAVALLPLHNALEVAEQIALVDVISGGRVEPGFGVGYRKPEYSTFRVISSASTCSSMNAATRPRSALMSSGMSNSITLVPSNDAALLQPADVVSGQS
jgi:alkanesulfonate monooxygenase SsuD/methylene tetrahydromethanopterin reductase-like flavin-dependent oxidoreductase (luciferase family)